MTAIRKATVALTKDDIYEALADYIEKNLGGKDRAVRPSKQQIKLEINTAQTIPVRTPTPILLEETNLFVDVEVTLL